jgi:hypothetical protein
MVRVSIADHRARRRSAVIRSKRDTEAAARTKERREREDAAPRLVAESPQLRALTIAFAEGGHAGTSVVEHMRHVVIAKAPALFEARCPNCKTGVHDFTTPVMRGLRSGAKRIVAEVPCDGTEGATGCACTLRLVANATYGD